MATICDFCGNKIGFLSQQIEFKDGVMGGKCMIKYGLGYKNGFAPGAKEYGKTHTVDDFKKIIAQGKDFSSIQEDSAKQEWLNSKDGQKFQEWLATKQLSDINPDNVLQVGTIYDLFKNIVPLNGLTSLVGSEKDINANQAFLLAELTQQNWLIIKQNDQLQKQNQQIIDLLKKNIEHNN